MSGRKNIQTKKFWTKINAYEKMSDEEKVRRKKVETKIRVRKNVYEKMSDEKMPDENLSWNPPNALNTAQMRNNWSPLFVCLLGFLGRDDNWGQYAPITLF